MSTVVLFGALLASLSMIYDKESGVMRILIIAPLPRAVVLLARTHESLARVFTAPQNGID